MSKLFISDFEVPETCPIDLLLPNNPLYLEPNQPSLIGKVSPIEVSWILFSGKSDLTRWGAPLTDLRDIILNYRGANNVAELHEQIANCDFLNHHLRVVGRVALDPRRYERFSLYWSFRRDRGVQFPTGEEEEDFAYFHQVLGVVERK